MKQSVNSLILFILLPCNLFSQNVPNWQGYEFEQIEKPLIGDYKFYELTKDYTLYLPEYFTDANKLPNGCGSEANIYYKWAKALPVFDWDFIKIDSGGILTIKQGYRWDGATNGAVDVVHNHRPSMVHDAFYDLMRMQYLERDYWELGDPEVQDNTGDYNRKLADMLYFIIDMEDGDTREDAEFDYFFIRNTGRIGVVMESRLKPWKFHVSGLSAIQIEMGIKLTWLLPDIYCKSPVAITPGGYNIYRNGSLYIHVDPGKTSYIDTSIKEGESYTYQLLPNEENKNQYDWSNVVSIVVKPEL